MASEELSFLRDQVHRLNSELSKYREQNIQISSEQVGAIPAEGPAPPWLTDKSLLSPLLAEYDTQIKELQLLVTEYEKELKGLRPEVARLVQENDRLSDKLRQNLDSQLQGVSTSDLEPLKDDEQVLHNLEQQAQSALQEKESAIERWHEAEQEIDRLQQQLQEEKNSHQWGVIEQQAHQMQSEYFETVNLLNRELEQVQLDLRDTKQELETATLQLKEVKKNNKELEHQLNWKDQEMSEVIFKEGITDSKVGELKRIMDDLRRQCSNYENENEDLKREKSALEVRITEMQRRSADVSKREMEAVSQMREAVQMVEAASLDKEQADSSVQQKEEELEQLREVINKLINEAGARTRQEVDAVRSQCNDRINKLTSEVHALEMDNAEKQDQLEKAMRDKRAAESELEKVYREGSVQMTKEMGSYENMNTRAINAERARDDANLQVDSLQHELKREKLNAQQLKEQLEGQLNNNRDRMTGLQQDFENLNDDRVRLLDEIDDMKKRLLAAQQEKEAAQRKYQKEITIFENENNMKLREFEVKLQSTEDVNRHSMTELRKLLSAQQRMCARWKEECTTIAQKYEDKLKDARADMTQLKKRNSEVTKLLKDSQEKLLQAEKMISDYTRGIQRMEQRMRDSESRAADATKQLSRHRIREKQMESERRSLTNELKRSTMETSIKSVRSHPDELLIGDLAASQGSMSNSVRRKGELGVKEDIDEFLKER